MFENVWLIIEYDNNDTPLVVGVCSTKRHAEIAMKALDRTRQYDCLRMVKYEVDGVIKDICDDLKEEIGVYDEAKALLKELEEVSNK